MRKIILITTLLAGTLDISAAFIRSYFTNGVMPSTVLKFIASGVFGRNAYSGGAEMILTGLLVHYFIAFSCTACFFWVYPRWQFLRMSILLNSILIALIAWAVTTQIIMPISKVKQGDFDSLDASAAIGILIICVGLPVSCSAKRYFNRKEP